MALGTHFAVDGTPCRKSRHFALPELEVHEVVAGFLLGSDHDLQSFGSLPGSDQPGDRAKHAHGLASDRQRCLERSRRHHAMQAGRDARHYRRRASVRCEPGTIDPRYAVFHASLVDEGAGVKAIEAVHQHRRSCNDPLDAGGIDVIDDGLVADFRVDPLEMRHRGLGLR